MHHGGCWCSGTYIEPRHVNGLQQERRKLQCVSNGVSYIFLALTHRCANIMMKCAILCISRRVPLHNPVQYILDISSPSFTQNPLRPKGIVVPCSVCPSICPAPITTTAHNTEQILFIFGTAIDLSWSMNLTLSTSALINCVLRTY